MIAQLLNNNQQNDHWGRNFGVASEQPVGVQMSLQSLQILIIWKKVFFFSRFFPLPCK